MTYDHPFSLIIILKAPVGGKGKRKLALAWPLGLGPAPKSDRNPVAEKIIVFALCFHLDHAFKIKL